MKFNIKNLFNKKSLKKLEKATLVGVASLALIVPLGMGNGNTASAMSRTERNYYLNALEDPNDYIMTMVDELRVLCDHPSLKYTHQAVDAVDDPYFWDCNGYDYYAHHFKQLYTPKLYRYYPKRITARETCHYRHDNYLIHKGQEQLGLLGHHRSRRHARRQAHKRHANHRRNARRWDARKHGRKHARKRITYYY